jgi:hypothetical protein
MVQKYKKRADKFVVAVQINLDLIDPIHYRKWGGIQMAQGRRPFGELGDWLVQNDGDVYTVEQESFADTYAPGAAVGQYVKTGFVWAEKATEPGSVPTKEGSTASEVGDYLVANNEDGTDRYAVSPEKFEAMYEVA